MFADASLKSEEFLELQQIYTEVFGSTPPKPNQFYVVDASLELSVVNSPISPSQGPDISQDIAPATPSPIALSSPRRSTITSNAVHNDTDDNKESATIKSDWRGLIQSHSFCSRILILIVVKFLGILSFGYTLSQIYRMELTDYWCETKTLDEIHQHSINIGSQTGDSGNCWTSKNSIVI